MDVPDEDGNTEGYERFECGYESGGRSERPCPSDPKFPKFDDYDLTFQDVGDSMWRCYPLGRTPMARSVSLPSGGGPTKQDAEAKVRQWYDFAARKRGPWD